MSYRPVREKQLVLLYDTNHYDVITSFAWSLWSYQFSSLCFKSYNDEGWHTCTNNPDHCLLCLQTDSTNFKEAKCRNQPPSAPYVFWKDLCAQNHLTKSFQGRTVDVDHVSVCTQVRKCRMCKKLLEGLKEQKNTIAVMQSVPRVKSQF